MSRITRVHHRMSGPETQHGVTNMVSGKNKQLTNYDFSVSSLICSFGDLSRLWDRGFDLNLGFTVVEGFLFGNTQDFYGGNIN